VVSPHAATTGEQVRTGGKAQPTVGDHERSGGRLARLKRRENGGLGHDASHLGGDGVRGSARVGDVKRREIIILMSPMERARYVRWWKEESGLTPHELRDIATTVWADRSNANAPQPTPPASKQHG
jgi:hypothetical protein